MLPDLIVIVVDWVMWGAPFTFHVQKRLKLRILKLPSPGPLVKHRAGLRLYLALAENDSTSNPAGRLSHFFSIHPSASSLCLSFILHHAHHFSMVFSSQKPYATQALHASGSQYATWGREQDVVQGAVFLEVFVLLYWCCHGVVIFDFKNYQHSFVEPLVPPRRTCSVCIWIGDQYKLAITLDTVRLWVSLITEYCSLYLTMISILFNISFLYYRLW